MIFVRGFVLDLLFDSLTIGVRTAVERGRIVIEWAFGRDFRFGVMVANWLRETWNPLI